MLNHVTIMGRLTQDPELRRTTTDKAVVSFNIACDKPGKDKGASFIPCVAWEKTGEFINAYFSKGNAILLEGRMESRQYETKDGQKRTVIELVVSQAHFCGEKKEKEEPSFAMDREPSRFNTLSEDELQLPF